MLHTRDICKGNGYSMFLPVALCGLKITYGYWQSTKDDATIDMQRIVVEMVR